MFQAFKVVADHRDRHMVLDSMAEVPRVLGVRMGLAQAGAVQAAYPLAEVGNLPLTVGEEVEEKVGHLYMEVMGEAGEVQAVE